MQRDSLRGIEFTPKIFENFSNSFISQFERCLSKGLRTLSFYYIVEQVNSFLIVRVIVLAHASFSNACTCPPSSSIGTETGCSRASYYPTRPCYSASSVIVICVCCLYLNKLEKKILKL